MLRLSSPRPPGTPRVVTCFCEALEARSQDVVDRCTRCGGCFEVCPMTVPAGIAHNNSTEIVTGVTAVIPGDPGSAASERWAQVCSGSGSCIPRCEYGVNPRFMLTLARLAIHRRAS